MSNFKSGKRLLKLGILTIWLHYSNTFLGIAFHKYDIIYSLLIAISFWQLSICLTFEKKSKRTIFE
jgi:hypothetical protein